MKLNEYLTIINDDVLNQYIDQPHTYHVVGPARSGTSAMSLMLRRLGVYMGEIDDGDFTHECKVIGENRNHDKKIRHIIRKYDSKHDVWGFKYPSTTIYSPYFLNVLRNPITIMVTRNIDSVVRSNLIRANKEVTKRNYFEYYNYVQSYYDFMFTIMSQMKYPYVIVKFEEIIQFPLRFARETNSMLRLNGEEKVIENIYADFRVKEYKVMN